MQETLGWPFFDDAHRGFTSELALWAAQNVPPIADAPDAHHGGVGTDDACRRLVKALGDAGWLKAAMPAEFGGPTAGRHDVRHLCLARDVLAQQSGLADFAFAMQGLGTGPLVLFGSDEQKRVWLPQVAAGDVIAAFALSEAEAGSDVAALATTAVPDGDAYVLNGEKTWISNGGIAGLYIVFARTGEAPGAKGLSAFIVTPEDPGFGVVDRIEVTAPHPLATLGFRECRIPKDRLIGTPGQGFKIAMATLDVFRSTVGAAALGFARRALKESLERANSRKLFGATLGDLQLTQAALADSATEVDAAALLVYRAAWTKDQGVERVTKEAGQAKLFATECAQKCADRAVQIFGGLGVTKGSKVEELYREVRALRIYEGASEVQKVVIARALLAQQAAQRQGETP